MRLVIDVPDEYYNALLNSSHVYLMTGGRGNGKTLISTTLVAVANGTPLPKGHGRLGDLDALYRELETKGWFDSDDTYYGGGLEDILLSAPTIIEADKEEQK